MAKSQLAEWEKKDSDGNSPTDEVFLNRVHTSEIIPFEYAITLTEGEDDDAKLSEATKKELKQLGGDDFSKIFESIVSKKGFGAFTYSFFPPAEPQKLREALVEGLRVCDETRSLADAGALLSAGAFHLTKTEDGPTFFGRLESENLMNTINRFLGTTSVENWRAVKNLLFSELELGDLSERKRSALLKLYDGKPDLQKKMGKLLDSFAMIREADQKVGELPSPFETYYTVASFTPPREMQGLTSLLTFISENKIFAKVERPDGIFEPKFPAIYRSVYDGAPVGQLLHAFSTLPFSQETNLSHILRDMFHSQNRPSGVELHLSFLQDLLTTHAEGVASWISEGFNFDQVPRAERAWGLSLVQAGDHLPLWKFFSTYGTRTQALALIRTLQDLQNQQYLAEAFRLLLQVQDVKLRRVFQVFLDWHTSGELKNFFKTAQILLEPLR